MRKTTNMIAEVNIRVARNGYVVTMGNSDTRHNYGNPYVFETFGTMQAWLADNLEIPEDSE